MPIVSIIIPTYNCGLYLPEAIDSVLAQTFTDWECIIVDDGSTDNSAEVAQKYCSAYSQIKYVYQQNQGVSMARNTGIAHSSGKYIMPLDSDDFIASTYIEKAVNFLEGHHDTKLVYCYAQTFGTENKITEFPEFDYDTFLWGNQIFNYAVYRRTDFDKTSGYNLNMKHGLEDWDFFLSLLSPTDKVFCIKEPLYFYRKKETSRSISLDNHRKAMLVQIYKNHPEIYTPFNEEIVYYRNQATNLKDEVAELHQELDRLRKTKAFRIGKILTLPFRWFRK